MAESTDRALGYLFGRQDTKCPNKGPYVSMDHFILAVSIAGNGWNILEDVYNGMQRRLETAR